MADVIESGLAYEIRKLEARLNRKHSREVKTLEARIEQLETDLGRVAAWIGERQREKAQKAIDEKNKPPVHQRQEGGEVWLKRQ